MQPTEKQLNSEKPPAPQAAGVTAPQSPDQQAEALYAQFTPVSAANDCKTFGEKAHHWLFDIGINFAANLVISAGFTHWFKHSHAPIWENAPFGKNFFGKSPENAHAYVQRGIRNTLKVSDGIAGKMTDALTLTTGGHIVMIPSVWLGEKIKTSFVQTLDNWHYGKDQVAQDPWIAHRHTVVNQEAKPSLLGTVVGRAGTVVAVQLAAMTLGDSKNMISWAGNKTGIETFKKFAGLDHVAGRFGDVVGRAASEGFPNFSKKIDQFARNQHLSFSSEQTKLWLAKYKNITRDSTEFRNAFNAQHATDIANGTYNRAVRDYSKYVALDTLYTWVTMATVKPIINWVNSYIPGITYQEKPLDKAPPAPHITQAEYNGALLAARSQALS